MQCYSIASPDNTNQALANVARLNVYTFTSNQTLREIEQTINLAANGDTIWWYVLESTTQAGPYNLIYTSNATYPDTGKTSFSSGPISVQVSAGKYYAIGAGWNSASTWYYQNNSAKPVTFGAGQVVAKFNPNGANPLAGPLNGPSVDTTTFEQQLCLDIAATPTPSPTSSPSPTASPSPTPSPTSSPSPTPSPSPFDNALAFANTIPTQIPKSHPLPVTITMQNTGNTTWSAAGGYDLFVTSDPCGLSPSPSLSIAPAINVLPGQQYIFSVTLNGPASGGPCTINLQMRHGAGTFGDVVSQTLNVVDPINDANIVGNTIPAQMYPGQGLAVDITVRNRGNTTWIPGGNYFLKANTDTCSIFAGPPQMLEVVSPNKNTSMLAYLVAPLTLGPCDIEVQMTESPGGGSFGVKLNLTIQVVSPPNALRDWNLYE
ncbi:hypothetical protein HYR69_02145 [Candidatus Sumerlaeota bacterium]|nr:hypothetical protein [Candidatus Sumerlaeota bacterium]